MSKRVAVIDKAPSRTRYTDYFPFEFTHLHMSQVPITKLLKKDVTLEFDPTPYDLVILVGSEAAKEYAKVTSVTNMAGQLVNEKFICLPSPATLSFKPEGRPAFEQALDRVLKVYEGAVKPPPKGDFKGINTTDEAKAYLKEVLENAKGTVAWDTETTALYPRDGYVLGVSMSYKAGQGRYILTDCLDEECTALLQEIANTFVTVFHNMKFDYKMLQYHLGIEFPRDRVHDTMCMHYVLDENDQHGLKHLALKYTEYGNYDAELDTFKKEYCSQHGILQDEFTYDLIPFDTISEYACLTHESLVCMADGTKKTIGDLVRTRSKEPVLSFNETTKLIEAKPITGWIKLPHKSKEWYSLVKALHTPETSKGPKFTPDHKVLLKDRGWTQVADVRAGDRILSQELDISDDAYQILYGSMMGDGRFDSRNSAGAGFMVSQASTRAGYAAFKASALGCTKFTLRSEGTDRHDMHVYASEYTELYTDMFRHTVFRERGNQKPKLTAEFVSKLDLRAIAIWYMDDGNLANCTTPRIWSRSASVEERESIITRMVELGLAGARFFEDDAKNNTFFTWDIEHSHNFFKAILQFMHPDCLYKVPKQYHDQYKPYGWRFTKTSNYYSVIYEVATWTPCKSKRGFATKWCIDVEGNHNFFTDVGLVHNCKDTAVTYELYNRFWPLVQKNTKFSWVYQNLLINGTLFLMDMEEVGIPISRERMQAAKLYLDQQIYDAKQKVFQYEAIQNFEQDSKKSFNPNSVMQLRTVLFDYLKLEPTGKRTGTGAVSTDAEVLQQLAESHPLPGAILKVRQLGKIQNTYISKILPELDRDGRIRTNFNLTFTTSGRLSSSGKFNAQQIPRDDPIIKGCILAPAGYKLVSQD